MATATSTDGRTQEEEEMTRVDAKTAAARIPSVFEEAFLSGATDVTQLLLIRHGQQQFDRTGPVGEMFDPPLSELGVNQARLAGLALSTSKIDAVYASPLQRALETGREIARHHRLEPVVMDDLKEVGIFRDIPPHETATAYIGARMLAGVRERMMRERSWDVYPYSESSFDFRKRVVNAIESIIVAHPSERLVIACHGGVINAYVAHIIGTPYDMFFQPAHTSLTIVAAGGGRRALQLLNDVHHLTTTEGDFRSV